MKMKIRIFDLGYYISKIDIKVLTITYNNSFYGKEKIIKTVNFNDFKKIDKSFLDHIGVEFQYKCEEKKFIKNIRRFFYNSFINPSFDIIEVKSFTEYYKKYFKDKLSQMYNFEFHNFYIVKCGTKEVKLLKNINTDLPFYRKKIKIFGLSGDYILAYNYRSNISDLLKFKKEDIIIVNDSFGNFFIPCFVVKDFKCYLTGNNKDFISNNVKSFKYAQEYLDFIFDYFSEQNQDLNW